MRRGKLFPLCLLASLSACVDIGPLAIDWGRGWGCSSCDAFWLTVRGIPTVLRGDTIQVDLYSEEGPARVWRVRGGAFRIVDGDSLSTSVARESRSIVLKAIAVGPDTVFAQGVDTVLRTWMPLRVVDSAAIARVRILAPDTLSARVGAPMSLFVAIEEASGGQVNWPGPVVSISDTTVMRRDTSPSHPLAPPVTLIPQTVGRAQVILRFRELSDTITVVVQPAS